MKRILSITLLLVSSFASAQQPNNKFEQGFINAAIPQTPESSSFEKYGTIPSNEFTGTASINIPLYTLKGKFMDVPVSVSYHASGIKVSQEATIVGLGFDLNCGGRVTIETRGGADEMLTTFTGNSTFKTGLQRMFAKWRTPYGPYQNMANNNPKIGYAFIDYGRIIAPSDTFFHPNDTLWDENLTVSAAAWYGAAEPDIYHANFMGNSVKFYIDIVTGEPRFIGENNRFHIALRTAGDTINAVIITDNAGIQYYFEQKEVSFTSMPVGSSGYENYYAGSAYLLTRIKRDEDVITFTYTNYGPSYPAVPWSQSISGSLPDIVNNPSDTRQAQITQYPYYLSKVESGNGVLRFVYDSRVDMQGNGSKKLAYINVEDKVTGTLLNQYNFEYDYFMASAQTSDSALPDYKAKRLRLRSISQGTNNDSPWKFFYSNRAGPNKYSFAQDHWGYFNGANTNSNLIPRYDNLGSLVNRSLGALYTHSTVLGVCTAPDYETGSAAIIPTTFQGGALSRSCDATEIVAYMLDSLVYPTGGATKFQYEPHQSTYHAKNINNFLGGGLRIKRIKNYVSPSVLTSQEEYDYQNSGVYLGAIEYLKVQTKWPGGNAIMLSAWGESSPGSQKVGYSTVKKIVLTAAGAADNGYTVKHYHVAPPLQIEEVHAPAPYNVCRSPNQGLCAPYPNLMFANYSGYGVTGSDTLEGRCYKEEVFNANDSIVRRTEYHYRQAEFSNNFYSMRAEDNYFGYVSNIGFSIVCSAGFDTDEGHGLGTIWRWRRWQACMYPAPTYYTVLDSLVETHWNEFRRKAIVKKSYKYNSFGQTEFESTRESDSSETITYLKTPLSFPTSNPLRYSPFIPPSTFAYGTGEALLIEQLKGIHSYDTPIETITMYRNNSGDTSVLFAEYNVYDWFWKRKAYAIEPEKPLTYRSEFSPANYQFSGPDFSLIRDTNYQLQDTATYANRFLQTVVARKGVQSYIWDEGYNVPIAVITQGRAEESAFTSFETTSKGNWSYSGTPQLDADAPTGVRSYLLSLGSVTRTGLSNAQTYIVSYWSKNGAQNVNGASSTTGATLNGYTFYTHRVQNPSGGIVTVSGSGVIDELRLYRETAAMVTYCYKSLKGIRTICDEKNQIIYYEYDDLGRLQLVRDQDRNILKKICYNYAGQPEDCTAMHALPVKYTNTSSTLYTLTFTNTVTSAVTTYSVYVYGTLQNLGQIPEGTYNISISPQYPPGATTVFTYNGVSQTGTSFLLSNVKVVEEFEFTIEPPPVIGCSFSMFSGYTSPTNGISSSAGTTSFYMVFYPTSTMYAGTTYTVATISTDCRPSATRTISYTTGGRNWTIMIYPGGQMTWQFTGSDVAPNTTISTSTLTYNL